MEKQILIENVGGKEVHLRTDLVNELLVSRHPTYRLVTLGRVPKKEGEVI